MRRYEDPVEVRRGPDDDPEQFLWRGRLWQVREVAAHWVETGAWWARQPGRPEAGREAGLEGGGTAVATAVAMAVDGDLLREREVWRVTAARGRELGFGVFDLVFSWSEGSWQLVRALD